MNYFDKVHKYPEIHNYENAVIENKYFLGHMRCWGKFTAIIIHDFFKTKNENTFLTHRVSTSSYW
jgi:hypothetical protein